MTVGYLCCLVAVNTGNSILHLGGYRCWQTTVHKSGNMIIQRNIWKLCVFLFRRKILHMIIVVLLTIIDLHFKVTSKYNIYRKTRGFKYSIRILYLSKNHFCWFVNIKTYKTYIRSVVKIGNMA